MITVNLFPQNFEINLNKLPKKKNKTFDDFTVRLSQASNPLNNNKCQNFYFEKQVYFSYVL